MTKFRPCIDLHAGQVKQIVGGTLTDQGATLETNHVSPHSAGYFARLYRQHHLVGGHVIMLGPGNDAAAVEALAAWPRGLQVGGSINEQNAKGWLKQGAEKIIVTSYLFPDATFSQARLDALLRAIDGNKHQLVIDLSCRRKDSTWYVATNRWQNLTTFEISTANIKHLEQYCSEFLIHAADNEGLQRGIDEDLVRTLSSICDIPVTYAGGAKSIEDLQRVDAISMSKVDVTIGSALDVFGGSLVRFRDCVQWNTDQGLEGEKTQ